MATRQNIREALKLEYPKIESMPYCSALLEGRFTKEQVLTAEVVELYRALNTRHVLHGIHMNDLETALRAGALSEQEYRQLSHVARDEGETKDHIDHFDMRLMLFSSVNLMRGNLYLVQNESLDRINDRYVGLMTSGLIPGIAANAAIEDWYVPIAAFFEQQYLVRGFSPEDVTTYTVHKAADVWHSSVGLNFLESHSGELDMESLRGHVREVFRTSIAYDQAKLELATSAKLDDVLRVD